MASLWHETPLGENVPNEFNVIVEIPKGSNNKYEIDKKTGLISLDRANYSAHPYPFDYGFAPQTLWYDNDPLDVVILSTFPLHPGILVSVRPVALMEMIDSGESDYKIIAVPAEDKRWEEVRNLSDVNKHSLREIKHFFETYKELKGEITKVEVPGYKDKNKAMEAVRQSMKLYKEKYPLTINKKEGAQDIENSKEHKDGSIDFLGEYEALTKK